MKVLHFYKTYLPETVGGVEQVIYEIIRGCLDLGIQSEVLALSPNLVERSVQVDGHWVHRCRSNFELASTPFSLSAIYRFRHYAQQADIIHYHYPYPFADMLHLVSGLNKPSVVTYHSDVVKQKLLLKFYRPLKRKFLGSVDRIVATSPNYLQSSDVLTRCQDKVSVIPIGLNKDNYPSPKNVDVSKWRAQFGGRFFLFVGLLRYYKGLHILIEAAKGAPYPIIIVGSGPVEAELKCQVKNFGVNNIHFLGRVSEEDKTALLQACYGFIFPSHLRSEAFGVSLLEAAMYGKPLICSEIGTGTTHINIDSETGKVVPPDDPFALRQAMDYLWDNPDAAAVMGANAETRYKDLFTASKMVDSYADIYRSLLSNEE